MRLLATVLALLLTGCGGGNSGSAPLLAPPGPTAIDMDRVLDDFVADNSNVPSVALLAVKSGAVLYSHAAGVTDAARTRPASASTLYKTSSIAKLIIAVAVMQQLELGVLDLDADVGSYLPFQVRNPAYPNTVITSRMLMQHAAGLAHPEFGETTDDVFVTFDSAQILQLHPLIEDIFTPGSAAYTNAIWVAEPGTVHRNSNIGMVLLSYLVEELSGLHFIDYCKWNIFVPLGMNGTSHYYPDLDPMQIAALFDSNNNLTIQNSTWFYPISGLFTSTNDWSRFMLAVLNRGLLDGVRILDESSIDQMLATISPANNQLAYNSNIGLIWREAAANPGWIGHTGAGSQMTHVTEINPQDGIGYVLFTNEGGIDAQVGPGGSLNVAIHQWLAQQSP
jgi:CubicO group peptidase (beta-lactamase class C family)